MTPRWDLMQVREQPERLTGRYAVSPGLILTVTLQSDQLSMQENSEEPGELFAESELQFFSKTSDDVVTFEVDAQNRVVRLMIHTGGRQYTGQPRN